MEARYLRTCRGLSESLYDRTRVTSPFDGAVELADDARALFAELERDLPDVAAMTAECRPAVDVLETTSGIHVVVDLPGVRPDAVRVVVRRQTVLIVGAKGAPPADRQSRFHLAERSYGRFARAVRLTSAFDATKASATTDGGQLRIVLPRIEERRGQLFSVPVTRA